MSHNESEIIVQLLRLSFEIDEECKKLLNSISNSPSLRDELLKICDKIKRNCEVYETTLRGGVPTDKFIVILNLLDIIGPQRCQNLKDNEVEEYKKNLERFSKNYLTDSSDPVLNNLYQLHYSDPKSRSADSSVWRNVTNVESAEISGSKVEELNSNNSADQQSPDSLKKADISTGKINIISEISLTNLLDTSSATLDESKAIEGERNIESGDESGANQEGEDLLAIEKTVSDPQEESSVAQVSLDVDPINPGTEAVNSSILAEDELEKTTDQVCLQDVTEVPSSTQRDPEECATSLGSPESSKQDVEGCKEVDLASTDGKIEEVCDPSEKHEKIQAESEKIPSDPQEQLEQVDDGDTVQLDVVDGNSVDKISDSLVDSTTRQQNESNADGETPNHPETDVNDEEQHIAGKVDESENIEHESSQSSTTRDVLSTEVGDKEPINDGERNDENCSQGSTEDFENPVNPEADDRAKSSFFADLGLSKTPNCDQFRTIRDELMAKLSEVSCQEDERGAMREIADTSSESNLDEELYNEEKVAEALRELEEDSSTDIQSGSDVDVSSLDIDSFLRDIDDVDPPDKPGRAVDDFAARRCSVILERMDLETLRKQWKRRGSDVAAMEKNGAGGDGLGCELRECKVLLEPLRTVSDNARKPVVDEDALINRLCEISTLEKKRKREANNSAKRKIKRKRKRRLQLSGSETSDLSGYSTVSEEELEKERLLGFEEDRDDDVPIDPNTLLAEIVCHTIHDSDSDSSSVQSSEEEERKRRRKNGSYAKKEGDVVKKEPSWKDDPLLKGNLNGPSDKERKVRGIGKKRTHSSDDEEDCNTIKKARTKNLGKYLDPNYSEYSTNDSSDDFEDTSKVQKNKEKCKNEDSDIEYVGSTSSNVIHIESDEETARKNCRRNILSVLSSKNLTESTQKAAEEEKARVKRLEEQKHMRSSQESTGSGEGVVLDVSKDGSKIVVDPNLSEKLFAHQVDGVKFMWDACYLSADSLDTFRGTGCILAHNMGLGKTFQVVTLVHTLFNHPVTRTKHVLVVCPLSTVSGWKKEFVNASKIVESNKGIKIFTIDSKDGSKRKSDMIISWRNKTGVLIIGYEAFCRLTRHETSGSLREALVDPGPDLVVCDEGHLLKNGRTLRTKALMEIRTKRRIALTGTPLQNNLNEYYHMVQFVKPNLLGTKKEFHRQFINPIMNGQYENSLEQDITLMKKRTHVLHRLLKNTIQRYEATELHKYLENMKDYTLFIQLHPVQEKLYRLYLEKVRGRVNGDLKKTFFVDYQILKYICSHPQLLHTMETQNIQGKRGAAIKEHEVISEEPEVHEVEGVPQDWWKAECSEEMKTNIEFGTKLQVMMAIIEEAEKRGEKVLIFTSSLVELSSVEFFLKLRGTAGCSTWKSKVDYFRMDGTVPPSVRTKMCDLFNDERNRTMRLFLMSHKVGGLGLNLVAANRVVLLGANFNPSLDTQSIYRVYRFGQKKNVYVYRLLSMGTMEEKIYHRCVTKLAIASRVVDKHQIARHYKNLDLEGLYKVDIDLSLQRTTPAKPDDDILSTVLLKFDCIYKYHHHQKLLENRPDEELNEEDQKKAWEEFEQMNEKERNLAPVALPSPNVTSIVEHMWNQINQHRNFMTATDPFRSSGQTPASLNSTSFNYPATHARSIILKEALQQRPPMDFSVEGATNQSTGTGQPVSNNVSGLPPPLIPTGQRKTKGVGPVQSRTGARPKATAIGPNPFVLTKGNHRRENVQNASKTNWRTSSSDDFQRPGVGLRPNWGKGTVKANVPTRNAEDVVVIDISEDTNDVEEPADAIDRQVELLRGRNFKVTKKSTSQKEAPTTAVIDIT